MKLTEAWHLSRIPYREVVFRSLAEERGRMWWGAFGRSHFDKEAQEDIELTKRVLRIAKFDKSIVAVFCVISAVMPFTSLFSGVLIFGLTSAISLSLAVTFGFTALYAIQTLSSFVSAESSALLSTLPLSKDNFSRITLFSFIRSVDYMVVGSILSQVTLVAYLTASSLATLLMLGASIMNSLLAVAVALWFSRLFYRNLVHGGRSKGSTALRLILILMWGSLLLGVGLLLSVPWYIVPNLEKALLGINQISSLLFFIIYPFTAGIVITNLVHPSVTVSTALTASIVMVGYVIAAGVAGKWILETIKRISQGTGAKVVRIATKDFSIRTCNSLLGYIKKDLRISSRNPATAFFFALPVLETAMILLLLTNYGVLRISTILVATIIGGIFALLMPLALLSAEGKGLEYTKTLPVRVKGIIACKTLISTATYIPVPLSLLVMALVKPLTSSLAIMIPCINIMAIASASIFEIRLFLSSVAKRRIAALMLDLEKLIIGVMITLIPVVAYVAMYFVSCDHVLAILVMGLAAVSELAAAVFILNASERKKF